LHSFAGVEYVLRKLQKYDGTRGLTVLVTYEGLRRHKDSLNRIEWTGVCLDEGQKIRNPAADISIVCKMLPSYHR
jgi:DNA excision repair protein ERCC-6